MPTPPAADLEQIERYCDARVPAPLRDEARIEATRRGNSVTIFDFRATWQPGSEEWSRAAVAQLRYSDDDERWSLYYADSNSRWHLYDLIEPGSVAELLEEIDDDPTGIFWG